MINHKQGMKVNTFPWVIQVTLLIENCEFVCTMYLCRVIVGGLKIALLLLYFSSSLSLIAWLSLDWHWPKTLEYCIETLYISKIRRKFCCHFCVVFIIFNDTREIVVIQLKRIHRPRWKCHLYKSSLFVINSWQRKSYFIIIIIIIISPK